MKPKKEQVGNRIRDIRTNLDYSLNEFGKLVGDTHKSTIYSWEKGISLPKKEKLEKIALLGNVSLEWLLFGSIEDFVKDIFEKYLTLIGTEKEKNDFLKKVLSEIPEKKQRYDDLMWLSVVDKIFVKERSMVFDNKELLR